MRTRKPCRPWLVPAMMSCANTTAQCAWMAELVIQYFCRSSKGGGAGDVREGWVKGGVGVREPVYVCGRMLWGYFFGWLLQGLYGGRGA